MSFIRETPLGEALRAVGLRANLAFPEEVDDLQVADKQSAPAKEQTGDMDTTTPSTPDSEASTTLETPLESTIPAKLEIGPDSLQDASLTNIRSDPYTVDWNGSADSENPRNWSALKKCWVVFVVWYVSQSFACNTS